jgi:hypothetical protein
METVMVRMGSRNDLDAVEKSVLLLPGIAPRFFGRPACSLFTVPAQLSHSLQDEMYCSVTAGK